MRKVAIIGIGAVKAQPKTPTISYKELTYKAAKLAYQDAHITHRDIDSFVTLAEDFNEGTAIFDEYTPDQLGAVLKPMQTICHDGLVGIANAYMQIASGLFDVVVVESHSKISNLKNKASLEHYALDPNWVAPLNMPAQALAALEANCYAQTLNVNGELEKALGCVVTKNKANAKKNPYAAYAKTVTAKEYEKSPSRFTPLKDIEIAPHADGACVVVLASEDRIQKSNGSKPVWILGAGWATETSEIGSKDWRRATYAKRAAQMAYKMAEIRDPKSEIDFFEIDDTYAFKELQHLEALGVCEPGEAWKLTLKGVTQPNGARPVNVSGGCLGLGETLETKGLYQVLEIVSQLRGGAGKRQLSKARRGLAFAWRGVPTTSGACLILGANTLS